MNGWMDGWMDGPDGMNGCVNGMCGFFNMCIDQEMDEKWKDEI